MRDVATEADREVRAAAELYRHGDLRGAENRCRQVLRLVRGHRDACVLLGLVLFAEARYGEAEAVFSELASREPRDPMHWINLGTARRGGKRWDAALAAYARAAEAGAASADFYYNVGLTHIDRLDFEAARAVLERAAALEPTDAEIRYRYAQSCYESRRVGEAARALEGWATFANLSTEVTADIGYLLMNLGQSKQADIAFERVSR